MAIDYDSLMAFSFADVVHDYDWKFSATYALGLGVGHDPLSPGELRYVYEKAMEAVPTMAVVLGQPGNMFTNPGLGIDMRRVLHGEQTLAIERPLAPQGRVVGRNAIHEIIDKGEGRGAIVRVRRDLFDEPTGELQSSQICSMFCRADGGFGGPAIAVPPPLPMPNAAPDMSVTRPTLPQAALIYRLSGDDNPLHADPVAARLAGFDRPILHGMATFGIAGLALIDACADGDASALRSLASRFTAPVYPGETLRTDIWDMGGSVLFRCTAVERDVVVLDHGEAHFA